MSRNMDTHPYTADELRVVEYLSQITPDIGAGPDPIGFLIASHAAIRQENAALACEAHSYLSQLTEKWD